MEARPTRRPRQCQGSRAIAPGPALLSSSRRLLDIASAVMEAGRRLHRVGSYCLRWLLGGETACCCRDQPYRPSAGVLMRVRVVAITHLMETRKVSALLHSITLPSPPKRPDSSKCEVACEPSSPYTWIRPRAFQHQGGSRTLCLHSRLSKAESSKSTTKYHPRSPPSAANPLKLYLCATEGLTRLGATRSLLLESRAPSDLIGDGIKGSLRMIAAKHHIPAEKRGRERMRSSGHAMEIRMKLYGIVRECDEAGRWKWLQQLP